MASKICRSAKKIKTDCCGRVIMPGREYKKVTEKGEPVRKYCVGYCR